MAKVAVTGGLGFLGRSLVEALVRRGDDVRVVDDASRGNQHYLNVPLTDIEIIQGDVRDAGVLTKSFRDCDRVYHLAAINGTRNFYERPRDVLDVGINGTMQAVLAAERSSVGEFFFMSSSEVYQTPPFVPTNEAVPLCIPDVVNPRYSYGGGKLAGELICLNFGRDIFNRMVICRPHNIYGPRMGYDHVIPELAKRMLSTLPDASGVRQVMIQGDGSATRSFCYVDDFTQGVLRVADHGDHLGIYHLGTEEEVTILDLAHRIARHLALRVQFVPTGSPSGQTLRRCPDIAKARALGYSPRHDLESGLSLSLTAIRSDLESNC